MDAFFAQFQARLTSALAGEFREILRGLEGRHVYAAAVVHDRGLGWRCDLNTAEAFESALRADEIDPGDTDMVRRYRWSPNEWRVVGGESDISVDDLEPSALAKEAAAWRDENLPDSSHDAFTVRMVSTMIAALDSADVRRQFRDFGANPILVVAEIDGPYRSALRSLTNLNADNPNDAAYADAVEFWTELATEPD